MTVTAAPATPEASDAPVAGTAPSPRSATVLLLFVLGAAIPVAIAAHYGALEIPRSDDWSYLLTLFNWVDGGKLDFNGWVSMTLVGQLVIAAPLVLVVGRSITAVHVLSAFVELRWDCSPSSGWGACSCGPRSPCSWRSRSPRARCGGRWRPRT